MSEQAKPQREQNQLLNVEEGDFLRALSRVNPNRIDPDFVDNLVKNEEIVLWQVILDEYELLQEMHIPKVNPDEFLFGARYFILILNELKKTGYRNPKVSEWTAYTYFAEKTAFFEAVARDSRSTGNPVETYEELEELLDFFEEKRKEGEFQQFTRKDIITETPFIQFWLESLPIEAQSGMRMVYELKSRQLHADRLSNQIWG